MVNDGVVHCTLVLDIHMEALRPAKVAMHNQEVEELGMDMDVDVSVGAFHDVVIAYMDLALVIL